MPALTAEQDVSAGLRQGFVIAAAFALAIGPAWLLPDSTPLASVPFVLPVLPLLSIRRPRLLRRLAGAFGAVLCTPAIAGIFLGGAVLLPGGLFLVAAAALPRRRRQRTGGEWTGTVVAAFAATAGLAALVALAVERT